MKESFWVAIRPELAEGVTVIGGNDYPVGIDIRQ
jgi:hypothetical protein